MTDCRVDEIADGVYRLSTHAPDAGPPPGLTFNQFVVLGADPLLFHTGPRALFPAVLAGLARLLPLQDLRWLSYGHVEDDECGSMGGLLAAAPQLRVWFEAGDALDLGGRRVRRWATPNAPHNPEAAVLFEEVTETLLCGDLLTQLGPGPALMTDLGIVERAVHAEAALRSATDDDAVPAALRQLAVLAPRTLAVMHGSSYDGDGAAALRSLADEWDRRLRRTPMKEDAR